MPTQAGPRPAVRPAEHEALPRSGAPRPAELAIPHALFFASGFAGLVYQVLWMRELGLLFGNDAQAAATTLAAFFLGIAAGGAAFGRRAERVRRPLLAYAWLEAGVTATALLYFGLLDLFHLLYAPLFDFLGPHQGAFLAAKFALGLAVLFPPAFFMGGTLPMMSQHGVRRADALGTTTALLYAINTLGAALGAFAAAFLLVPRIGVNGAYGVALATTAGVALLAAGVGRADSAPAPAVAAATRHAVAPGLVRALAFFSGWATLALEVLWTRMFAQVVQNSVYTFALILVNFLVALALGAALARLLAARLGASLPVLGCVLVAGALAVIATPFVFLWETDGLQLLAADRGFADYVASVFGSALRVLGIPTVCLGLVFPYLLKLAESWGRGAGRTVGELAALNTLGAVLGSVSAGFLLLDRAGLWASLGGVAALYLAAGAAVLLRWRPLAALGPALALALLLAGYDPAALPLLPTPEDPDAERIVETLEGTAGTVAVVDQRGNIRMKLNSSYGLGGSGDRSQEARQAHVPLVLHPDPKRAFFLGLGSGITAGAALQHPLEELWVAELLPEVVEASERHFAPWVGGLFDDPRVQLRIEDGRNVLLGARERFDLIVADLFLPWKAGVGSLYAREHYEAARDRLAPGGLYAQWLLLIQFSRAEFGAVARTLVEVFPRVTLWRGNFRTTHPLVLLVGEIDPKPLDPEALAARLAAIERNAFDLARPSGENAPIPETKEKLLYMYLGNLSAAAELLDEFPINSDDRPVIEYSAPVTHRRKRSGEAEAFRYRELLDFYDAVFAAAPPETDPVLADTPARLRNLPRAGLELERGRTLGRLGEEEASKQAVARSQELLRRAYASPKRGAAPGERGAADPLQGATPSP